MTARPLIARLAPLAALALVSCASASLVPDQDRQRLINDYQGRVVFLRASLHVMPFYRDGSRRLVSPLPPDSVHLIDDPSGKPILPGPAQGLLTQGSRVRIEKVEFPTSLVVTRRPLYAPRTQPWIYLSVVGERGPATPYVAVLRQGLTTREQFAAAMDQLFVGEDPETWLRAYSPEVRAAMKEKRLVAGMDATAVELAWGRPERIQQEYRDGVKVQTWTWPLEKRSATLRDGKLVGATPALEQATR